MELDYDVFYSRAYGESWDELSEEEVDKITEVFMAMDDVELELYDEYLSYDNNDCVIDDAIRFATQDRYNPNGEFGYPFLKPYSIDKQEDDIKLLERCRLVNELTNLKFKIDYDIAFNGGIYLDSFWN